MDKFGRNYSLFIQTQAGGVLQVSLPFTIEFDITRNTLTSANVCQIRLYNLSLLNRNQIRFNVSDYGTFRSVELRAGYGPIGYNLPVIFTGNISQAWSVREGVNFITQIECYDGGFAFNNGNVNLQFPAGAPMSTVIGTMIASGLPRVSPGVVGNYDTVLTRPNSYSGNTTELLTQLTGGGFFIDGGKANALKTDEYINDGIGPVLINTKTGLLNTPVLEQTIVRFDMIFEPSLNVGRMASILSATEGNFNGLYKITAVKHRGMISEAVCGSVVTTGEFFYTKLLTGVTGFPLG